MFLCLEKQKKIFNNNNYLASTKKNKGRIMKTTISSMWSDHITGGWWVQKVAIGVTNCSSLVVSYVSMNYELFLLVHSWLYYAKKMKGFFLFFI